MNFYYNYVPMANAHNGQKELVEAEFLYQIARLYYEDGLTQEEIAREVRLSRQKVQRLLDEAKREGIVHIHLVDPTPSYRQTERELEERFGLSRVLIVPGSMQSGNIVRRNVARAAARYLEDNLIYDSIVGLAWGRTVYETINYFRPTQQFSVTVIPLTGGMGQETEEYQVNELARRFAQKAGGSFVPFHAPVLVDNADIKATLVSDRNIGKVVKMWESVNIAVVGIGGQLTNASRAPLHYHSDADLDLLKKEGYVGDILSHFLRKDGTLCSPSLSGRVVGISLQQLKKIRLVIGIAGSTRKKEAILAVLRGQYIDVLVTDSNVAADISGG